MFERDDREDRNRERSLLAFGPGARSKKTAGLSPSLLSSAEEIESVPREDAATRHRIARAQREAQTRPLAASESPYPPAGTAVPEVAAPVEAPAPEFPADDQRWKPLIDPMKVVGGIARSKKIIVATTILGALLGVGVALSTPKKYEATTELIADPRDLQITDHDLTQSGIASDTTLAIVENQVRVLTSGTVLNETAQKLNLFEDPEFNGKAQGYPGVMALIRSVLSRGDAAGDASDDRRNAIVIRNLAEALSVERGSKTFVISIGVKTRDGEKSALIANTMADVFLQTYGKMQSETAGRATGELTGRLDELRKSVEVAERAVETFKAEHDLVDAQGRLISDDELLKLNEQLTIARARTLELTAKAASARAVNVDSVLGGTLPEEIASDAMNDLRSQYAKLKQEADRADVRLGPRHPERLALDAQLAGARQRIAAELRRIGSSLQTDLKRAVQLEQQLSSRLAQLKVRSGDVNSDLVTARELEREANAKRAVYEAFLLRAKQTGEQRDINTANISVISKAYAPLDPTGPSRALTAIAGLLLGFASGVGIGAMRGAYESLRETADERSRRLPPAPRHAVVGSAPPPPPAPPPARMDVAGSGATPASADAVTARPNPVEALTTAIGRALQRRTPALQEAPETAAVPRPAAPVVDQTPAHYPASQPGMPPQPVPYPMVYAPQPSPYPPQPVAYPYGQAMPQQVQPVAYGQPPYPYSPVETAAADAAPIEEIRASLREFREAVRELAETRKRRRYF